MQSNVRFYALLAVVLVSLGGLWFLIGRGGPKPEPAPVASKATEKPEKPSAPSPESPDSPAAVKAASSQPVGRVATPRDTATTAAGEGSITGIAKDDSGDPIAGATVRILPITWKHYEARPDDAALMETTTGGDGKFSFSRLPVKTRFGIDAELGPLYAVDSVYIGEKETSSDVTLTLSPMSFIAGTVVNADGEPVHGAILYPAHWQGQGDDLPVVETEITRQQTDETGAFRFPHVPPLAKFKFLVKSKNYAPLLSDWLVSGTESAQLVLREGGSITGRVMYAQTREPAKKITVLASTDEYREELRQESDVNGGFSFANLRDTGFVLSIDSETLTLTKSADKIKLAPAQNISGVEIEIDKGATVSGHVLDGKTAKGVRDARIQLYPESRGGGQINVSKDATTDEDGTYTISGLPGGNYTIYVSQAEGYVSEDYQKRQIISVAVGQSLEDIDFTLETGGTLAGRVIDEAGDPVAEARIQVALKRGGRWASAESDINGMFTVMGVAAEPEVFVRAEKKGMASAPVGPFDATTGAVDDVVITLLKEASIAGLVVDESGKPVPNAQVIPYKVETERQGFGSSIERANEKGEFTLGGLSEGEYQLQAIINDGGWTRDPNKEKIRVAAGESKTGVRVVLQGAGGLTIAGRVTGEDGKPVQRAQIWVSGPSSNASAQTDSDGKYKVAGVKEGNFYIQFSAQGFSRANLQDIPAGSENVDIVLKGTGKIEGKVVDAATGNPVTDFEIVYAANAGADMRNFRHMGPGIRTRSEDGSFRIENAEAGVAGLLVKGQGYAPKVQQVTDIVPGETKSGVVIEVEAGGRVGGHVLDGSRNPVAGAQIFDTPAPLADYMRERSVRTTSATDGSFQLDGLPNGNVTISAYHAGYAGANVLVNVAPGKTTQADIVLGAGGTVRLRVTENGQPATNAYAGIQDKVASDSTAEQPDANGVVELKAVPPGDYRAYCGLRDPEGDGPSRRNQGREIVVTEGAVTEVAFDFAAGTASIAGTVTFDGQPPSRAWINISLGGGASTGEETRNAQVDANGQFRVENLPPGQAHLDVNGMLSESNMVTRQQTVELVDGKTTEVAFDLSGGGSVTSTVSGIPAGGLVRAMLVRGSISLPARVTQEDFTQLHRDRLIVGGASVDPATGSFTISGIEPGQYTVCVFVTDTADSSGGFRCATAPVSVTDGETTTASLALPR